MLAIKQRLIHQLPQPHAVIASLGYDEVRFLQPVRPDDVLRLRFEYVSRRESTSRPERGIVTLGQAREAAQKSYYARLKY